MSLQILVLDSTDLTNLINQEYSAGDEMGLLQEERSTFLPLEAYAD